ncbi:MULTISPECIES: hypothetical protein [unclassified Streptomyces]|uniref:hypothetical protein n=1 Tax=unclassified Streptomyces TaxID=2593676 RepID=UPI0033BC0902
MGIEHVRIYDDDGNEVADYTERVPDFPEPEEPDWDDEEAYAQPDPESSES